ncbi:MAG: response regulator [Flavobacteriaceae bacterium]|nr:response regulator [Flavobacteriaceae bacterium]
MKFNRFNFLLFLVFYCSLTIVNGQSNKAINDLKFRHYSSKAGLSQSTVICILQDSKGFLWFGTRDGLNRYDGSKFEIYRHDSQDTKSLNHSFIKCLFEDKRGNLWIGTSNGLNLYDPINNNFERFQHSTNKESIVNNEIWSINSHDENNLWLGTNSGLDKFNINSKKATHFLNNKENNNGFSSPKIRTLLKASNGDLWIVSTKEIGKYSPKTNTFKRYLYPQKTATDVNINNVPSIYEDHHKNIWFGYEKGLYLFNKKTESFDFFLPNNDATKGIDKDVRTICEDSLGNLWIGTYNGLYIISKNKNEVSHFVHDENNPYSLSQNSIWKIFEDTKGDMWIGTYAGGINYYDRNYDLFKNFIAGIDNSKLNYKVVSSIHEDAAHNLWIGTEGGGINFYHKKTNSFKYYTHDSNDPNTLSNNNVKAMIISRDGHIWIGTHKGGLNVLNPKKTPYSFKKYKNIAGNTNSISDDRVISLFEDYQDNIWIGTSGGGLNWYNRKENKITRITDPLHKIGAIIYTIKTSSDKKTLLIGSNQGLSKINILTKEITSVNFTKNKNAEKVTVLCVFLDENATLWIGTEGQGIYQYNSHTKESIQYGITQGLPNEVIYAIIESNNALWISTNYGLSQLNLKTNTFKNFDEFDGLQGNEFNHGAYLKHSNGDLIFGGVNGCTIFNPIKIIDNPFIPPVSITNLTVNNKPYLNITDATPEVQLTHKQNVFTIKFSALSYSQPEKNQYAYTLEGFDTDWNFVGNKKSATYTNLNSGDFLFKVKASNSDGVWNEKGAVIHITVLPAPWKTMWAYTFYLLIFLLLIYFFRKFRLSRINEKNELKLEKLEKEKIKEISKLKLKLFTNISHDFRTPLTLITGPVEQMLKIKNSNPLIKRNLETIQRNTDVLLQLINELLDFRKFDSGKLELQATKNDIISFTENIKKTFDQLAVQKSITFTFNHKDTQLDVWFDVLKLKKILFNLLSNAFKFTSNNSKIIINISVEPSRKKHQSSEGKVKIDIINYGKLIPKKHIKDIFKRFYQFHKNEFQSGTGIGLSLAQNLIELHKGSISVTSSITDGTYFSILLPLGKKHLTKKECISTIEPSEDNNNNFEKPSYVLQELRSQKIEKEPIEENHNKTLDTILVVEDNTELRNFIKNIFLSKYNILEAKNGKEGFKIAKENIINLIISDIKMPEMDGFELCNHLKKDITTSHIPVILLTAKTSQFHYTKGYEIGADAYITKPFNSHLLEIRVHNLIKSRKNLINKFKKDTILNPKELTATSADENFLEKAIQIVEVNMSNPDFTIHEFTREMHMSRSGLYKKLKSLTGQSVNEFVRTIKLKRAGQLISNTKMNISEIAYNLGFSDLKHFRKTFKNLFKELPSEYRISQQNSSSEDPLSKN